MKTVTEIPPTRPAKTQMKGYGGKGIVLSPNGNSYKAYPAIAGDVLEGEILATYVYTKAGTTVYLTENETGNTIATVRSSGTVDEVDAAVRAALRF